VVAKKQQQVTYQRNKLEARLKQTGVDLATEFPVMEVNTRQQVQGILDGKIVQDCLGSQLLCSSGHGGAKKYNTVWHLGHWPLQH
jgi:phytoene dehydrogenase-like protein